MGWFNLPVQIALGVALAGFVGKVLARIFGI